MIGGKGNKELNQLFADIVNYSSDDPLAPIDPLSYRSPEGDTCLHIAALRGDLRAAELLIEGGLDVNSVGDTGNTPLHYATAAGNRDLVDLLLSRGADARIRNELGRLAGN